MTEYNPHRWLVIKIDTDDGPVYKVFGTWLGGYIDGDSWKLNSGVSSVETDGEYLLFHGFSGSVYRVHKDSYGASGWSGSVLMTMIEKSDANSVILSEDTDWLSLGGPEA